jgi:hypothetical protein
MIRAYRRLRERVRRAVKPYVLLMNAWRFKLSEDHLAYLNAQREGANDALKREHLRQVRLRIKRDQIAKW